jgi:quercetin dioxygenase-like cupin family protein
MAYKNKILSNPKTGQDIRFIQTSKDTKGVLLEMESIYPSRSKEPIPHYHPFQKEDFEVLIGELTVRIEGELKVLKQGDTLHIPVNTVHSIWNNSQSKTVINWKVRPALTTEYLLETAFGLVNEGKTNEEGAPNMLQGLLLANKFSDVYRLSKPPYAVMRILFILLAPFAYLLGYRPTYKKYID